MEFPLHFKPGSSQYPPTANCGICNTVVGESYGFIRLTAGAIWYEDLTYQDGGFDPRMAPVFHLWSHGLHPLTGRVINGNPEIDMDNAEASLDIVPEVPGGQVDILFCSTKCVRMFFKAAGDELERKHNIAHVEFDKRQTERAAKKDDGLD